MLTPEGSEIAVFSSKRTGNERSNNTRARISGLAGYFDGSRKKRVIRESAISVSDPAASVRDISEFLKDYPDVRGIAVMNSRGYIVADILGTLGVENMSIVSFDLTTNNTYTAAQTTRHRRRSAPRHICMHIHFTECGKRSYTRKKRANRHEVC